MRFIQGFFNNDWRHTPENLLYYDSEIGRQPSADETLAINISEPGDEIYDALYTPLAYFVENNRVIFLKSGVFEKKRKTAFEAIIIPIPEGKTISNVNINKWKINRIYEGSIYPTASQIMGGLNAQLLKDGLPRLNRDSDSCTIEYFIHFAKKRTIFSLGKFLGLLTKTFGPGQKIIYDPLCKTDCNKVYDITDYHLENASLKEKRDRMEKQLAEKHLPPDLLAELGGTRKKRRRRKRYARSRKHIAKRI
jgi:hypothetical protein